MKSIVTIGGGNGSSLVLSALRPLSDPVNVTGIVSTADSGGSSGRLREEKGFVPTGDLLRAAIAVSHSDVGNLRKILYAARLHGLSDALDGHSAGNLLLTTLIERAEGDTVLAMKALQQYLGNEATVLPTTNEPTTLVATLDDGTELVGEGVIDKPPADSVTIVSVRLQEDVSACSEAIDAIRGADYIVLGPGDLHCSTIAALLPSGITEAIEQSQAKIVYVASPSRSQKGEHGPDRLEDVVARLEAYLPRPVDVILVDQSPLSEEQKKMYDEKELIAIDMSWEDGRIHNVQIRDRHGYGTDESALRHVLHELIGL